MCCVLSCVQFFAIPWTVAHQAPLSMEFSRQEYWSGLPLPSPGHLPDEGIEPGSSVLQVDSLPRGTGKPYRGKVSPHNNGHVPNSSYHLLHTKKILEEEIHRTLI